MKKEKPIKGRPWLIASETPNYFILYIFYPDGSCEAMSPFNHKWDRRGDYNYQRLKVMDKAFGFKTHFLGNL